MCLMAEISTLFFLSDITEFFLSFFLFFFLSLFIEQPIKLIKSLKTFELKLNQDSGNVKMLIATFAGDWEVGLLKQREV